jgi:hypothetical protein
MSVEDKLDTLIEQIKSDRKQTNKDRHENRMYICWGFTLSTLSLAVAHINDASVGMSTIATIVFFVFGCLEWYKWKQS